MVALVEDDVLEVHQTAVGLQSTHDAIRLLRVIHIHVPGLRKADVCKIELHLTLFSIFRLDTSFSCSQLL